MGWYAKSIASDDVITIEALVPVLDTIAAGAVAVGTLFGEGDGDTTISGAAASNAASIATIDDGDVQQELTGVLVHRARLVRASALYRALHGTMLQRALDRHLGGQYGSLSAFLRASDVRVHEALNRIGFAIDADLVFGGAVQTIATFETGVGLVTLATIDPGQRAAVPLRLVVTGKGDTAAAVTITLIDASQSAVTRTVNVIDSTAQGQQLDIGEAGDRFYAVTGITIEGGDPGDTYAVDTVVEREVSLSAPEPT